MPKKSSFSTGLITGLLLMLLYFLTLKVSDSRNPILQQNKLTIDSLEKTNKGFDDSLFYIGYNLKNKPWLMDSLYRAGKKSFSLDKKQPAIGYFHGF